MIVQLPWPSRTLSPNDRSHWAKKAKAKAKARSDAGLVAGPRPQPQDTYPLKITFHPPTNRARDIDNCLASLKASLDGIAEKWGINDKLFTPITVDFGHVVKRGLVVVEIKDNDQ